MKCPKCSAQLLLVKNDYFCLQCGELIYGTSVQGEIVELLQLETTSEPVLQRAILDASDDPVIFKASGHLTPIVSQEMDASAETHLLQATSELGLHEVLALTTKAHSHNQQVIKSDEELALVTSLSHSSTEIPTKPPSHKDDLHIPGATANIETGSLIAVDPSVVIPVIVDNSQRLLLPINTKEADIPVRPAAPTKALQNISRHWTQNLVFASVGLGVLALVNVAIGWYFQDKFYPGVSVAGHAVGGTPLASAVDKIGSIKNYDYVDFVVGSTSYHIPSSQLGVTVNTAALINRAKRIGRDSPFPIMGLYESLRGRSLSADYSIDAQIFEAKIAQIAAQSSHQPTSAQALIVGTNVISLSEKDGDSVDSNRLEAGVKSAIQTQNKVVINTTKSNALVKISSYQADISAVQTRLALILAIKLRNKTITVPPAEIASWISFSSPGNGAHVDQSGIATYVETLGSGFDRSATVEALISSVTSGNNLSYTPSTAKTTSIPKVVSTRKASWQLNYCVVSKGVSDNDLSNLASKIDATYADTRGWALAGLITYNQVPSGCNYTIWLASANDMDSFSPACHEQSTCRLGNDLIINFDHWNVSPSTWSGTLNDYRSELINHETGHWLGFDHLACGKGVSAPIEATSVLVWGCSPNWWSIAPELQGIKVLPGF